MREGVVSSATFMVNTPHAQAAAVAAREGGGAPLAIGLHLNLARGRPLSPGFPAHLLAQGELSEAHATRLDAEVVEAEAHAQLTRLEQLLGAPATHIDVHKHLHRHPAVLQGLARAARAAGLPVRSIDAPMRAALQAAGVATNHHFLGDAGQDAYWTLQELQRQLAQLPPDGVVELMCHPGYAPETLKSGYAAQREVELHTFLDPRARALLAACGVPVADFRVLHGALG
jgi:hypothetical protein